MLEMAFLRAWISTIFRGSMPSDHQGARTFRTPFVVQRIQVERLTVSVAAFIVTVDLVALRGKMTDVAGREWQRSFVPRQNIVIPAKQRLSFCLATQSKQLLQRMWQMKPFNAQPESAVNWSPFSLVMPAYFIFWWLTTVLLDCFAWPPKLKFQNSRFRVEPSFLWSQDFETCVKFAESHHFSRTSLHAHPYQWSEITQITIIVQRNRRIHSQGFTGSFNAHWPEWPRITDPISEWGAGLRKN